METPKGHDRKFLVCLFEFLGQIFFMYCATVAGCSGSDWAGIAGPLALFAVINVFGSVSGGHFNPAVTLGVYVREAKWVENFFFCIFIIASQILGATVGAFLSYSVLRVQEDGKWVIKEPQVPLMVPDTMTREEIKVAYDGGAPLVFEQNWSTAYMEIMCTFIFVLFILHVTGKRTGGDDDIGFWKVPSICLVLWALINVDHFGNASFNPALGTATFIMSAIWYPYNVQGVVTHYMWQYLVGSALGGFLAGVFYHLHSKMFDMIDEEARNPLPSPTNAKIHDHETEMYANPKQH